MEGAECRGDGREGVRAAVNDRARSDWLDLSSDVDERRLVLASKTESETSTPQKTPEMRRISEAESHPLAQVLSSRGNNSPLTITSRPLRRARGQPPVTRSQGPSHYAQSLCYRRTASDGKRRLLKHGFQTSRAR